MVTTRPVELTLGTDLKWHRYGRDGAGTVVNPAWVLTELGGDSVYTPPPVGVDRDAIMVPGTYDPYTTFTAANRGVLFGPLTDPQGLTAPVRPVPQAYPAGWTVIGSPTTAVNLNVTSNGQLIEKVYVWGDINLGAFSGVEIRDFVVRGGLSRGPSDLSYIYGSNDNLRGANIHDGLIFGRPVTAPATYNGQPVADAGSTSVTNEWRGEAIRGGNYTIKRVEITRTGDGIGLTAAIGNVVLEALWIHASGYNEWVTQDGANGNGYYIPAALGSQYTHSDAVQFNRGKFYRIRGCMLGGKPTGSWAHNAGHRADIIAGDDYYNACMMIKQEVDNTPANKIEDVIIEYNVLGGGIASINNPSGRDNDFASMFVRHNKFLPSTWGTQMYILIPLSGGVPTIGNYSDNLLYGTNTPVPYTRGA